MHGGSVLIPCPLLSTSRTPDYISKTILIISAKPFYNLGILNMKLITRLNERFGLAIRDKVISDLSLGNQIQSTEIRKAIKFFSILILATPYLVFAAGCSLIYFSYPSIPLIVVGLIIVAIAVYLRSHKPSKNVNTYGPAVFL